MRTNGMLCKGKKEIKGTLLKSDLLLVKGAKNKNVKEKGYLPGDQCFQGKNQ